MSWHHIKGAVTIASIAIGFTSMTLTTWMVWVSTSTIEAKVDIATLTATTKDIREKVDWLVQRNGANPDAIKFTTTYAR